jgi:hypothetical protein
MTKDHINYIENEYDTNLCSIRKRWKSAWTIRETSMINLQRNIISNVIGLVGFEGRVLYVLHVMKHCR